MSYFSFSIKFFINTNLMYDEIILLLIKILDINANNEIIQNN